ncbi:type II glyceraldehyde-3-phosphate dehydrogenase [Micromonospora sp. STR1_7]|uniref:Type II glyceraldehyde-3-phosphate dehydrogenase n=1 Tax=Micromonospora parastrephiae TaxID=2806101 RepID=A0ABS1XN84_9ACTN|nr:type II glyceraldehyde-3-phosphate dehydrogenase [Micromonospora parastrephiae]MBM0230704.1 type II glyceraldehyde-3-phosphate dehydrogenase [Micromonospora parastrephiae]
MKIAVLGMGVIGKRLVDAVTEHPDLELVGVGIRRVNGGVAARPDLPYFLTDDVPQERTEDTGITVAGSWNDALEQADLVVDAGPSRSGAGRAASYRAAGVAVRYCGGERDRSLGPVLHPALNREIGFGLRSARLASCNTTAIGRALAAIGVDRIARAHATIIRCCTDSDKAAKGVTNSAVFDARPSHHATDLREIVPEISLSTNAVTVPMVSGHVILLRLHLADRDPDAAASRLGAAHGVTLLSEGPQDSALIRDRAMRSGAPRGDRYDIAVQACRDGDTLSLAVSLDNEAITIPETIDAILGYATEPAVSQPVS